MRRVYAGLLWALLGCDPTAGLVDSADAALPEEKRYFDGRGSLLSEGPWHRVVVDLDLDTLYHLGARRLDDEQPTFHLFGTDTRAGCQVSPNVGTWLTSKPRGAPFRLLPFAESQDARGRGRMRFTSVDCNVQELVVEDAGMPYPRLLDHGYLLPTKNGYTYADPWLGEQHEVAANLQSVVVWDDVVLLHADDRLKSFSGEFEPGSEWGNAPLSIVPILPLKGNYLVEDADGIHRVTFVRETLAIESERILRDACHLQKSSFISSDDDGAWVALQIPCENPRPTLLHLNGESFETLDAIELPFEADARYVRAMIRGASEDTPIAALYLTDVEDDGLGKLWAWRADIDAPFELGEHADLDSGYVERAPSEWDGSARINHQQLGLHSVFDWVRFKWDGTTDNPAERVLQTSSGDLLVNFDGTAGDLPYFGTDGYSVIARGIPPGLGELTTSRGGYHFARVDQFDGSSGRLRLGSTPGDPTDWSSVGSDVPPESVHFVTFMPALIFLEHWDTESRTGSLVAYNYALDARTTIAENVSSFDVTSYPLEGVAYAAPQGKHPGLWFSKAK